MDIMRHEGTSFTKTGWGLEPVLIPLEGGLPHPLYAGCEAGLLTGLYIWRSSSIYIAEGVTNPIQHGGLDGLNTCRNCKTG